MRRSLGAVTRPREGGGVAAGILDKLPLQVGSHQEATAWVAVALLSELRCSRLRQKQVVDWKCR